MAVSVKRVPGPGVKQLNSLIRGTGGKDGKVGYFESARYENGTPVAYVAAIQEFGSPVNNIPPRSFMRTTTLAKRRSWADLAKKGAAAVLRGEITPYKAMLGLVTQAKGDVQAKIASIQDPPLSPITLALRKVKLGMVPGLGREVTGRTVGIVASMLSAGTLSPAGVSTKPLIEPAGIPGGGTLFGTIDGKVE